MSMEKMIMFTTKHLLQIVFVYVFILIGSISFLSIGGCSNNGSGGGGFPQPEERRSRNGVLRTSLEALIATNFIENSETGEIDEVNTPTYEGSLIGPTLRITPGDSIQFGLLNSLPQNPAQDRKGAFPHDPYTTNFHSHGLRVSPDGISDNVYREMFPREEPWPVKIDVAPDHQSGTFWYHVHKHGSVSTQLFGGMMGFIIIEGGPGDLNEVPEIAAAKEILMGFTVIRTDKDGNVPFVNTEATSFASDPDIPGDRSGLWATYHRDDGSKYYYTTNGVTNPTLKMRPGEVQHWRLLNGANGETFPIILENHELHVLANDGINIPEMITLPVNEPYVMGSGNRVDLLIKAGEPGTYELQVLDARGEFPITQNVARGSRRARIGNNFPGQAPEDFPVTLATIVVEGKEMSMNLPEGLLPETSGIPTREEMLTTPLDEERNVSFEICGPRRRMADPENRLPSCGWYFDLYDADYWGGIEFTNLLMMRDDEDMGVPNPVFDPQMPRIDYQKEGLFDADEDLFNNMFAGNFEEWTIINRSFSDHPFHIHVNPFLITHINGEALPVPEWRDTILVPAATSTEETNNINKAVYGTVTFRTFFNPIAPGTFVMHCHILTHEDINMMQRITVFP
jgi:FtsP/CotA-like multicopper oxidase with cupredoxin domain